MAAPPPPPPPPPPPYAHGGPPGGAPTELPPILSSTLSSLSPSATLSLINTLVSTTYSATPDYSNSTDSSSNSTDSSSSGSADATTTSVAPVQITNSISLVACILVVLSYIWFRRKNRRIMERPSLILAVSMATADGLLHTINLFGYTDLPHNFICAFFGGFLYAWPTLISIFYSFCIALNTQLVFVFSKRPGNTTLKYYIGIPIALSTVICVPALGAGVYGYDSVYDLCWIASDGTASNQVTVRYLLTFGAWCLAVMAYLIVAAITIIHAVFSKSSKINQLASGLSKTLGSSGPPGSKLSTAGVRSASRHSNFYTANMDLESGDDQKFPPTETFVSQQYPEITFASLRSEFEDEPPTPTTPRPRLMRSRKSSSAAATAPQSKISGSGSGYGSHSHSNANANANKRQQNTTLSRRSLAMRALAIRLLGYILIPTICILPGVIIDLITKVSPDTAANIPDSLSTAFDTINGLVGLFNAILYAMDPALLALYHQIRMARRERRANRQSGGGTTVGGSGGENGADVEMAATRTGFSVYSTPPESPGLETPAGFGFTGHGEKHGDGGNASNSAEDSKRDLGNGTKIEVRSGGRFLSPLNIGGRIRKSDLGLPSTRTARNSASRGMGIVIRVEVEVADDQDQELARLERYLGGL